MAHDAQAHDEQADIRDFLAGTHYAVVGASVDREKYGNKVLRAYLQKGHVCVPVHPREALIEGVACVRSVEELPFVPHGLSIMTPPPITEKVVDAALAKGIRRLWMQPGAEHEGAIAKARAAGCTVLAHGPCLLVAIGYRELC
jgi:predicted CoA-binding protein